MITHHLDEEHLLAYAAGTLTEGWSIAVATHLALCPSCRKRLAELENVGGYFLVCADSHIESELYWEDMKKRIGNSEAVSGAVAPRVSDSPKLRPSSGFPEPLNTYFAATSMRWQSLGLGAAQIVIPTRDESTTVRLLKIPAGRPVPEHGHGGVELTLVMQGAFKDGETYFRKGDIEIADGSLTHQPVATADQDCICLAVTDAPLRFSSRLVRMLQPFLGI